MFAIAAIDQAEVVQGLMPREGSFWGHDPAEARPFASEAEARALIDSQAVPCHPEWRLEVRPLPAPAPAQAEG